MLDDDDDDELGDEDSNELRRIDANGEEYATTAMKRRALASTSVLRPMSFRSADPRASAARSVRRLLFGTLPPRPHAST